VSYVTVTDVRGGGVQSYLPLHRWLIATNNGGQQMVLLPPRHNSIESVCTVRRKNCTPPTSRPRFRQMLADFLELFFHCSKVTIKITVLSDIFKNTQTLSFKMIFAVVDV